MGVYFVYRSHYDTPTLNHVKKFKEAAVLEWFRHHWQGIEDAHEYVEQTFGCAVYGFSSLFERIAENKLAAPKTAAALRRLSEEHLYVEGEIRCVPHCIQVLTDDDELQMAYYFFDDEYRAEQADKTSFLLHDGWKLPTPAGAGGFKPKVKFHALKPAGAGEGETYLAFLAFSDSSNLDDLDLGWRIAGVRLPDLVRYLTVTAPPAGWPHEGGWPFELLLLRSLLFDSPHTPKDEQALLAGIRERPHEAARWLVHADWLEERGKHRNAILERALRSACDYPIARITNTLDTREIGNGPLEQARQLLQGMVKQLKGKAGHDPAKSHIQMTNHLAQLCLHADRWGDRDLYHRWILFDDLWASAHVDLANAILRYASRWDVLS